MTALDIIHETNQSISFVPGTLNSKASFSQLQMATGLKSGVSPSSRPNPTQVVQLYNWLLSSFDWQVPSLDTSDITRQFRTGKTGVNGDPVDTTQHEWWDAEVIGGDTINMWDARDWGFGSSD